MTVVADTGVLFAAADTDDRHHGPCARLVNQRARELVVPAPVVTETGWMIERMLGSSAEALFVRAIARGELAVHDLEPTDYERCAELIDQYHDLPLGIVDASVVAVAEKLGALEVATINHRDFRVVRPAHVTAFELVP